MASIFAALRRLLGLSESESRASPAPPIADRPAVKSLDGRPDALPASPPAPATPEARLTVGAAAPAQATLAMPQLVAIQGLFPARAGSGTTAMFTQGMIQSFAGLSPAFGALSAEGQLLPLNNQPDQALFSLYGTSFGGNGMSNFAIPNLVSRVAVGGSPVGGMEQQSLTLTWLIAPYPGTAPLIGSLVLFGGNFAPDGWLAADGTLLPIRTYTALFELIGATYGGDGVSVFALPNLNGAAAVGSGQGPGVPPVTLGQKVSGTVPGLGLNYLISTTGLYPTPGGPGAFPANEPFLGQVVAYAGAQAPEGWALCDGSLLPITSNAPLYSLIGTAYGGDGETDFALPDLRGRMLAGLGG